MDFDREGKQWLNYLRIMSNTSLDYPIGVDPIIMMDEVKAKTICSNFEDALETAEKIYGYNLKFTFTKKDVTKIIDDVDIYSDEVKKRVEMIIFQQMRKYQYLFSEH